MRHLLIVAIVALALPIPAQAGPTRQVNLPTRDIAYDPVSKKIYASVPSGGGSLGNTVTVIDPVTGGVGPSVFVGSEPGKIAISDDGQFLYVALDGAGAVRQVSLAGLTAGLQFSVGSDAFFGQMFVEDMAVLPGNPQAVAISRKYSGASPRHAGVAIYDAGVQRPTATPGHTGSNVIEFGAGASTLYGYNNETTEFGFRRMTVNASGVSVLDATPNLIEGFGVDIEMSAGRAYATSGRVVDAEAKSLVATFTGIAFGALVEPDGTAGRTFFLSEGTIVAFDATTFRPIGTRAVPGIVGTPSSLVRWRESGLAFRTSGNQIFLIETVLVTCLPPDCVEQQPGGVPYDFDGDATADIGVSLSSTGQWLIHRSSDGGFLPASWGCPSCFDSPVAADFDGDLKADVAVHRFSTGEWFVNRSGGGGLLQQLLGCPACADIPVAADYDGDGKSDIAVYRFSTGDWLVSRSGGGGLDQRSWGCPSCDDIPVAGDYDGDGKVDIAVYRFSSGDWFINRSGDGSLLHASWGCPTCDDIPVTADYDGDGKADIAVFRFSTGDWFINRSGGGGLFRALWGCPSCGDLPVAADYDGDGKADIAVYRVPTGEWFIHRSIDGILWHPVWDAPSLGDIPLQLSPILSFIFSVEPSTQ